MPFGAAARESSQVNEGVRLGYDKLDDFGAIKMLATFQEWTTVRTPIATGIDRASTGLH